MTDWIKVSLADWQGRFRSLATQSRRARRLLIEPLMSGDFNAALQLSDSMPSDEEWATTVAITVQELDLRFKSSDIDLHSIADAFVVMEQICDRRLQKKIPRIASRGRVLVATLESELHSFGVRIVSEQLRARSYSVETLIRTTQGALLKTLSKETFDVLALSVGHDRSLLGMADLISMARVASENASLRVVLGGQAFDRSVSEYDFLGADAILERNCACVSDIEKNIVGYRFA